MQSSGIVLLFLLCVAMLGVKETASVPEAEEETEVEFRTGSPQREPLDKRFLPEPEGHLLIQEQEARLAKSDVNDMETSETHHFRRRMRIKRRFGFPPFGGGFPIFGGGGGGHLLGGGGPPFGGGFPLLGGGGGGFPFLGPLLGILGLFG